MAHRSQHAGADRAGFAGDNARIIAKGVAQHPHAQRGYVSFDQLPDNERAFIYTARAQNIEGLAHLILSGQYLAFLPVHYARNWLGTGQMRSLLPSSYAYTSLYEIIRRKSAARTPAEKKFFELLQAQEEAA